MSYFNKKKLIIMAEEEGFEPSVQVSSHGHLANDWFQPLTHSSLDNLMFYKTY